LFKRQLMRIYRPADAHLAHLGIAKRPNSFEEDADDRPTKFRKSNYPQSLNLSNVSAKASQPNYGSADAPWQAEPEPPFHQPRMPKAHSANQTSERVSRFGPPVESSSYSSLVKPEPVEPDLRNVCRHIYVSVCFLK